MDVAVPQVFNPRSKILRSIWKGKTNEESWSYCC